MFKFRSVNNIVIPPAKTGNESSNKTAVIRTDHANKGNKLIFIPRARIFQIVPIKFIAPAIEDAPAMCKLKIAKSTDAPGCASIPANGG
ncbi:hypothetical protein [Escherichia coli]|uniref:hypothetical protein n=1 Tax=Escherichia coli TaxID=562 RepID=UPI001BC8B0B6|nr:hypothetical protein [Escherichia coli]